MRIVKQLLTLSVLLLALVSASVSFAASKKSFTSSQKQQIKTIVKDYLVKNPEILIQMSRELQKREMKVRTTRAQKAILDNLSALSGQNSAVIGNPNGKVTLVEFFDYACMYCRKVEPFLEDLIKNNSNLRVVYKNFPVMGPNSRLAAIAGIYVLKNDPDKFKKFHNMLMKEPKPLVAKKVLAVVKKAGVNTEKLKKILTGKMPMPKNLEKQLIAEFTLAQKLGVNGTPSFVIMPTKVTAKNESSISFVPGVLPEGQIRALIKKAAQ